MPPPSPLSEALKIVFLSPAAQGGGAEAALLDLVQALRVARPGWRLHVLAAEDGPLLAKLRAAGIDAEIRAFPPALRSFGENRSGAHPAKGADARGGPVAKLGRISGWLRAGAGAVLYAWKLRARLRQLRADIIHTNGMKMHLLGALARPAGSRLVWHLHDYLTGRPAMKPLLRRLAPRCALVIANSESVAADARGVLPATLPVEAVYNAIDLERFRPEGPALDLDALAGLPAASAGTVRVGLVATFAFWKGHEVFLRAAALVHGGMHAIRFYVIGGPVYSTAGSQYSVEYLRGAAKELGLADRVGFTGFVEDVPAAMRALDIVVHASTEPEPFGLVIVQAMACGRAVIVSAAGGACELVVPGQDALTHPPEDAVALADAIARLVGDVPRRASLGIAARRNSEQRFTRGRMAARLAPLYEALPHAEHAEGPNQ